jgi:hypothetical protein
MTPEQRQKYLDAAQAAAAPQDSAQPLMPPPYEAPRRASVWRVLAGALPAFVLGVAGAAVVIVSAVPALLTLVLDALAKGLMRGAYRCLGADPDERKKHRRGF